MRNLDLHEIETVSGGSVLSDLQSLQHSRPELTLSVLCLGAGAIVGGVLGYWGVGLGVTAVLGWIGADVYKNYKPITSHS